MAALASNCSPIVSVFALPSGFARNVSKPRPLQVSCTRALIAASSATFLALHRRNAARRTALRGLPPPGGVSRWLLAQRGTPAKEDDPDGLLMQEVDVMWTELEANIMYLPKSDRIRALSALCVAALAHKGQRRKSGEAFIVHPVAVAEELAKLKVPVDVVIGGLLHDSVEDNEDIQFQDLEVMFGPDVRRIVEGETKASKKTKLGARGLFTSLYKMIFGQKPISGDPMQSKAHQQAENLRDMFLAMADDWRVIIVKLADRLHNMRTLDHMPEKKRLTIAAETLAVFAPLAHRLGVWMFKTELEDLSFKYMYPQEFQELDQLLRGRRAQYSSTLSAAARDLKAVLSQDLAMQEQKVRFRITGREKGMYSLWYKMQRKNKDIDKIDDIIALRVVLDADQLPDETPAQYVSRQKELCYSALSLASSLPHWKGDVEIKDYIRFPKPNGYQSLHVHFKHNDAPVPLEVQIRTRQMHEVAEYGMASHWAYKGEQHGEEIKSDIDSRRVTWLASLVDKDGELRTDPMQFVQEVLRDELGQRRFVFLRDGKILNLSRGCRVLDAAFKIHTEVGLHMVHAEVNGQKVQPFYTLQNGDRVNIITSPDAGPQKEWLAFAYLRSTRSRLNAYFRKREKDAKDTETMVDLAAMFASAATTAAALPLL